MTATTTAETATRSVSHRCPRMGEHMRGGCPCHPKLPVPCGECYSVETITRQVPFQADERPHPVE